MTAAQSVTEGPQEGGHFITHESVAGKAHSLDAQDKTMYYTTNLLLF